MPEETLDVEAITDLAEKAQVIAEATNRRQEDEEPITIEPHEEER